MRNINKCFSKTMRSSAGFTMIEIIMILAIIGISSYIIGPSISSSIDLYNLNNEAIKLKGLLGRLQQRAIADQQGHGAEFSYSSKYYNVGIYNGSNFVTSETVDMDNGVFVFSMSITTPARTVYFDQFGAPGGGQFSVLLQNRSGDQLWVTIRAETGRIDII